MAQMEEITCTLSVTSGEKTGRLFLLDGKLISAELDEYSKLEAAHRIISWKKTVIDITESCDITNDAIKQPLMNILMEAMRLRDNAKSNPPPKPQSPEKSLTTKAKTTSGSKVPSKRRPWKLLVAVLSILFAAGGLFTHFLWTAKKNRLAYEAFVLSVKEAGTPEQKLSLLNTYIREKPDNTHT